MSSESIRSLPLWVQITVPIVVVLLLVGSPFIAGFVIKLNRRREVALAMAGNYRLTEAEEAEALRLTTFSEAFVSAAPRPRREIPSPQGFGALDVTFVGGRNTAIVDSAPTQLLGLVSVRPEAGEVFASEPVNRPVPINEEPTEEQPIVEDPVIPAPVEEPEEIEVPIEGAWVEDVTREWDIAEIWEGTVEAPKSPEMHTFESDPLGSWTVPPEAHEEFDYLPEADRVFRDLVARNWLTGEGADVSAKWEDWQLSLEGASAC